MNAMTPPSLYSVAEMERMAKAFAKSGLFGMKNADQALSLMLLAQAEGRHPATAARDYNIIDGQPAKKAEAMLRDFIQAGGGVEWLELTDALCRARFSHPLGGSATIDWTLQRARTAGIAGEMWRRFPRQMLRCRVISEGVRTVYPMATSGLYVDEEIHDLAVSSISTEVQPLSAAPLGTDRGGAVTGASGPPSFFDEAAASTPISGHFRRKSSRQLKAEGEDTRIQAEIDACDLAGLAQWEAEFPGRTGHLPQSWLDAIRDMIALRREEVNLAAAWAEMDEAFVAAAS